MTWDFVCETRVCLGLDGNPVGIGKFFVPGELAFGEVAGFGFCGFYCFF